MYKLCKTEQSLRRQMKLENGLLQIMLRQPYEEISISELCTQLDVPRKTFYRYFSSKEGCLQALIDHRLMGYSRQGEENQHFLINGFSLDLKWFFTFWQTQADLLCALSRNRLGGILVERAIFHSQEARIFSDGMHDAEYVKHITSFVVCGIMSIVLQWYQDGFCQSPAEMAKMTREMLLNPLIPH